LDKFPSKNFYDNTVDEEGIPIFIMAKKKDVKYSIYAFIEEGGIGELDRLLERMKELLKHALLKDGRHGQPSP
jgi:hypothetical protein